MAASTRRGHEIVVIGASSGGLQVLTELVAGLPADLGAAVIIVMHLQPGFRSRLPEILTHHGPLRARHAMHGEPVVPGHIYVAPPDNHVVVRRGYLNVVRGAKENNHRPSVDVLFRTAATAYGPSVIGVVLTGALDCGTAGLLSIKARGGLAVVQDPASAQYPEMPESALRHVEADHVVPTRELAGLITRLVDEPSGKAPAQLPGALREIEGDELGVSADIVCPLCHGKMTESELNGFQAFRCHVGHAFSLESVALEQAESVERALWAAARALQESSGLAGRLAASTTGHMRERFLEKEQAQAQQADVIKRLLLSGGTLSESDVDDTAAPAPQEPQDPQEPDEE